LKIVIFVDDEMSYQNECFDSACSSSTHLTECADEDKLKCAR